MVSLNAPIVRDGQIWICYGAWNHPYRRDAMDRVQKKMKNKRGRL